MYFQSFIWTFLLELPHMYCCSLATSKLRACSHGGGGPQVGEVPRLGGVTNLSIQSFFFLTAFTWEVGTLHRRVARSAVPGNLLRWGKFSPCECWRWGGVMFSWAFIHHNTNWKADRTARNLIPNISDRQDWPSSGSTLNGEDFEKGLSAMYTKIRPCLV